MSFIVSSTGKIETMVINDIPNQFILFHPITKKDLTKIKTGIPLRELQFSQILKNIFLKIYYLLIVLMNYKLYYKAKKLFQI